MSLRFLCSTHGSSFSRQAVSRSYRIRYYAARAPKVKYAERSRPVRRVQSSTWPEDFLRTIITSGVLPRRPVQGYTDFLDRFMTLGSKTRSTKTIGDLLAEYGMKPLTLSLLAKVLVRADRQDRHYAAVAADLLAAAVTMKDEAASLILAEEALRLKATNHPRVSDAFRQLKALAEDGNPGAMVMLALRHEQEGDFKSALKMANAALVSKNKQISGEEALNTPLPKAWKIIARISDETNDGQSAALEAIERAAFELDDSEAYYELARRYETPFEKVYMKHMLKSAASGNRDAAITVGQGYFRQAEEEMAKLKMDASPGEVGRTSPASLQTYNIPTQYSLAEQWFRLALVYREPLMIKARTAALYMLACAARRGDLDACRAVVFEYLQGEKWTQSLTRTLEKESQTSATRTDIVLEMARKELIGADDYQ